jgi:hypothetical protein
MNPLYQRIYAASQGELVATASGQAFAEAIARCATMTGQALPSPQASLLMHGVITDLFMWASCEDIELAVKLNFTGNLPAKVQPFGEFSTAYLSDILKMYEPERGKAIITYREIHERIDASRQLAPPTVTDDQWREMMEEDFKRKRAGTSMWRYCATRMVKWLEDTGQLTDATFTNDEWRTFNANARAVVMQRRKIGPNAVERMSGTERARFDQECLDEKKALVYGVMLDRMKQETKVNQ